MHDPVAKKIDIYGHSILYGFANHKVNKEIVQSAYPDYEIMWSNAGY